MEKKPIRTVTDLPTEVIKSLVEQKERDFMNSIKPTVVVSCFMLLFCFSTFAQKPVDMSKLMPPATENVSKNSNIISFKSYNFQFLNNYTSININGVIRGCEDRVSIINLSEILERTRVVFTNFDTLTLYKNRITGQYISFIYDTVRDGVASENVMQK
jgi:hypothetical protein